MHILRYDGERYDAIRSQSSPVIRPILCMDKGVVTGASGFRNYRMYYPIYICNHDIHVNDMVDTHIDFQTA